jgi:hypothetical protein
MKPEIDRPSGAKIIVQGEAAIPTHFELQRRARSGDQAGPAEAA